MTWWEWTLIGVGIWAGLASLAWMFFRGASRLRHPFDESPVNRFRQDGRL